MGEKSDKTFFQDWLAAYADHLHLVRQGTGFDLVQPEGPKPPLTATSKKTDESQNRKPSSA